MCVCFTLFMILLPLCMSEKSRLVFGRGTIPGSANTARPCDSDIRNITTLNATTWKAPHKLQQQIHEFITLNIITRNQQTLNLGMGSLEGTTELSLVCVKSLESHKIQKFLEIILGRNEKRSHTHNFCEVSSTSNQISKEQHSACDLERLSKFGVA